MIAALKTSKPFLTKSSLESSTWEVLSGGISVVVLRGLMNLKPNLVKLGLRVGNKDLGRGELVVVVIVVLGVIGLK